MKGADQADVRWQRMGIDDFAYADVYKAFERAYLSFVCFVLCVS